MFVNLLHDSSPFVVFLREQFLQRIYYKGNKSKYNYKILIILIIIFRHDLGLAIPVTSWPDSSF